MRITSITPMKNEGPYILEWVAYHRMIGMNDMYVFTNDCTDGTDLILERLDELGVLRHMPNPAVLVPNPRFHILLVQYVNLMPRLKRSDWVVHIDADEYIRVKVGDGHLRDLFAAVPDADAISLSLHTYGTSGLDEIATDDELMVERFVQRSPERGLGAAVKCFARGGFPWARIANNAPQIEEGDLERVNWINGDGKQLPAEIIHKPFKALPPEHNGIDLVDVAHYTLRSFQGFLNMMERGSANPAKGVIPEKLPVRRSRQYFNKFNFNQETDRWFAPKVPAMRDAVAELMADKELAELHEASLAWHKERAAELMEAPQYSNLYRLVKADHEEHYGEIDVADPEDVFADDEAPRAIA